MAKWYTHYTFDVAFFWNRLKIYLEFGISHKKNIIIEGNWSFSWVTPILKKLVRKRNFYQNRVRMANSPFVVAFYNKRLEMIWLFDRKKLIYDNQKFRNDLQKKFKKRMNFCKKLFLPRFSKEKFRFSFLLI